MSYFAAQSGVLDDIVSGAENIEQKLGEALESGALTKAKFAARCAKLGFTADKHGTKWDDKCIGALQAEQNDSQRSFYARHKTPLIVGGALVGGLALISLLR